MSHIIGLNAHLLGNQPGYRRAGIHGYIWQLLDHLPAAAPSLRYRLFVGEGQPPPHPAYTIKRTPLKTGNPRTRILWEQFLQPFHLGGLDLVHQMAFVAPLVMPRPFVVTVYDLTFFRYPERLGRLRRLYLQTFTRLSCQRARRIMAISQSTANDLTELLGIPPEKIDLAIPGVEPRFRPLPRAEVQAWRQQKGLPENFLLFVGTLEPRKNLPTLLQAYARLPQSMRDSHHLVIAGAKGWMVDDIFRTIEENALSSQVHLPGFVSDGELPMYYNAAEVFVYPSVSEGWGLPVTEAMACGKPVIISNVSSLPEAAGPLGLHLPPDDVSAWTEALADCIADGEWRAEQGELARQRARQFTWAKTAQQTVESYRKALNLSDA